MKFDDKHIILIGFKHVGKSVIGRSLAMRLGKMHIDLDHELEHLYAQQFQQKLNCREIVQQQGETLFRSLEHQALIQIMQHAPCVISLGGGTPMLEENRKLVQSQYIIHITAPLKLVFHRIIRRGRPAFFPEDVDPWLTFTQLWREREKVYKSLAAVSVKNHGSIASTMEQLIKKLEL